MIRWLHAALCRLGIHDWTVCAHMHSARWRYWHCDYCGISRTTERTTL